LKVGGGSLKLYFSKKRSKNNKFTLGWSKNRSSDGDHKFICNCQASHKLELCG